jgi:glycerol-3-phosphate acyltransferase PlsX
MAQGRIVKIAVDAMGGDYAPAEVIKGAVSAVQKGGIEVILVGPLPEIERELANFDTSKLPISCVNADEVIKEGEPPALVLRQKRDASMVIATKLVKSGEADAVVSAGPTGAMGASALMILGTVEGIDRPVIGGPVIGLSPNTVLVDCGGTIDCKPIHLLNFAVVGSVFAQKMLNIPKPTVALLSVGSEEGKGNELVKESHDLFKKSSLNYVGNMEGNDIVTGGANVIVCDGFVGNVLIKFCEALGYSIAHWLKNRLNGHLPDGEIEKVSAELLSQTNVVDIAGGGPLMGVNGVAIVMHGRSKAPQFEGAIAQAKAMVESDMIGSLNIELERIRRQFNNGN